MKLILWAVTVALVSRTNAELRQNYGDVEDEALRSLDKILKEQLQEIHHNARDDEDNALRSLDENEITQRDQIQERKPSLKMLAKLLGNPVGNPAVADRGLENLKRGLFNSEPNLYVGCFTDNQARHLPDLRYDNNAMTQEMCIVYCRDHGYPLAGVEYRKECFCGNSYDANLATTGCSEPCGGNSNQVCGGTWKISIYRTDYVGCIVDGDPRLLSPRLPNDGSLTIDRCRDACRDAGHTYAGVEYYSECFCGDDYFAYPQADEGSCNTPCSGNNNEMCGGVWRIAVFRT